MVYGQNATGQNFTEKNNPGQNATGEQTRYHDLLLMLFVNCCSYVTKCFNLFIGIMSLYLLNSFVNVIITFLFNIYLRVPYGICLSVLERKHHNAYDLCLLTGVGLVVAEFCC